MPDKVKSKGQRRFMGIAHAFKGENCPLLIRKRTDMKKEEILDRAADLMAEEILSSNPDIGKCFGIGLKAMTKVSYVCGRQGCPDDET